MIARPRSLGELHALGRGRSDQGSWCSLACSDSVEGLVSRPLRVVISIRERYFTFAHSSSSPVWQAAGFLIRNRMGPPSSSESGAPFLL